MYSLKPERTNYTSKECSALIDPGISTSETEELEAWNPLLGHYESLDDLDGNGKPDISEFYSPDQESTLKYSAV
jgi:hypothetical protein